MNIGAPPGIGSQSGGPVILELPLDKIRRPLMRTRANDPNKVQELMVSIREIGLQVPVSLFSFSCFSFYSKCNVLECFIYGRTILGFYLPD